MRTTQPIVLLMRPFASSGDHANAWECMEMQRNLQGLGDAPPGVVGEFPASWIGARGLYQLPSFTSSSSRRRRRRRSWSWSWSKNKRLHLYLNWWLAIPCEEEEEVEGMRMANGQARPSRLADGWSRRINKRSCGQKIYELTFLPFTEPNRC